MMAFRLFQIFALSRLKDSLRPGSNLNYGREEPFACPANHPASYGLVRLALIGQRFAKQLP